MLNSPQRLARVCLAGVLVFVLLAGRLAAQSVGGTIRGRVRDASGGAIAGATLQLRDALKGIAYQSRSDASGVFQIALPVGSYELEAAAPSFAAVRLADLELSLGQTLALEITLPVEGLRQSVEVVAAAPLVETSHGALAGLVSRERLAELPLNGRDFGQLALLQPGVALNANGANSPFGGRWATFVVNGQLDQSTLFLVDGSELNDLASGRNPSGSSGLLLGLDSVQEFQVLLHNYKAEFGKNSGGVIHVATRSGSNALHGTVFEYLRNSALDAKNFFDLPSRPIPSFRRNQFGGSLGGPLRRDRTFFFLSYEGLRERKAITSVATVPAAEVRQRAAAAVVPFLNLYPLPNGPLNADGLTASFSGSAVQPAREDFGLVRLDQRLRGEWNLHGKFSTQDSLAEPPYPSTPVPGFPQSLPHRITNALAGLTFPLSAHALSDFHFAFNRTFGAIELPPPPGGLVITPVPDRNFGLINVTGISNLGTQTFVPRAAQNLFEFAGQFTYRRGRHSQKYGATVQRYQDNELRGTFFNGQYTFAGLNQFLAAAPVSWIGVLGGTSAQGSASPAGWRWVTTSAYAQDDFELTPRLTLNLGVRYEFTTTPDEVNGQLANLRSPLDAAVTLGAPIFNTIARSWSPRFGWAWSPRDNSGGGRSALRGGFGVFFNPLVVNMWANSRLVPPFVNTVLLAGGPPFPDPLATGRTPALSTTGQALDFLLSQPYTLQWNIEWQQQVGASWIARVAYAGNRSLHILRSLESNPGTPVILADGRKCFNFPAASGGPNSSCPAGATVRRNLNFGPIRGRSSDGRSWYDSLQLTAERRFRQGMTLQGSYTWGKSLSTNNSSFTSFPSQPSNTQDPDNIYLDKGLSAFDVRQRLAAHFIVPLPSFSNRAAGKWLLSGWRIAGIISISSGYPFTVVDGINRSQNLQTDIALADRPDWAAGATADAVTRGVSRPCLISGQERFGGRALGKPDLFFDPCAFALQPAGFYGNVARNALTGPGLANADLSLSRTFALREEQKLEFRADLFNLLNRPNFSTPSSPTGAQVSGGAIVFPDATGAPAGNAGQIFRTVTDSRQIQFSLRYSF